MPAGVTVPLVTRWWALGFLAWACAGCHADRMLLYPQRGAAGSAHGERREIPSPTGGHIELFVARTAACAGREPEAFVLDLCGNGDRAEWSVDRAVDIWREQPVEIWSMNYAGYGRSTGPATLKSLVPAALAVYDHLAATAPGRPVYVNAVSIGTTPGLRVAAERRVAGIVLHNPPPLRQLLVLYFGWTNFFTYSSVLAAQVPESLDSLANARRSTAPAVFVLAGSDLLVPPPFQRWVLCAYAGPARVVKLHRAMHNTPPRGRQVEQIRDGIEWMKSERALGQPGPSAQYRPHYEGGSRYGIKPAKRDTGVPPVPGARGYFRHRALHVFFTCILQHGRDARVTLTAGVTDVCGPTFVSRLSKPCARVGNP